MVPDPLKIAKIIIQSYRPYRVAHGIFFCNIKAGLPIISKQE
jgi:hypothetical protein